MKYRILVSALALSCFTLPSLVMAQTDNNTANVPTEIQQNANGDPAGLEQPDVMEVQPIPVAVIKDSANNSIEARIADLKSGAAEIGIHQMVITGTKNEVQNADGTIDVQITWDRAYRITEDGDRKDTIITIPFESDIQIQSDLKSGDVFTAEGSAIELLAAWERLKTEEEVAEEEAEEEAEDVAAENNPGGAAGTQDQAEPLDFEGPTFESAADPVIEVTTDGCSVRVDLEQMVAIVQERTLEDGQEIVACQDTLTRYPLERAYSGCPLVFDTAAGFAYEQFTLSYSDPTAGSIQVQDCTQDADKAIAITETTDGCGLFHDFAAGQSFQQARLTYFYQGANQTLQDCVNGGTSYAHEITQDTCDPVVTPTEVTFQFRTRINVDGNIQYISDCEPDASTTQAISEEICDSPRYTHDFTGGQSYLNKNYYYVDGSTKVYVSNCVQSTTSFAHQQDETVCTPTNDDVNLETTLFARTFIEETAGNKTYIDTCGPVSPSIPYVDQGDQWTKQSTNTLSLTPQGTDSDVLTLLNQTSTSSAQKAAGTYAMPEVGYVTYGSSWKYSSSNYQTVNRRIASNGATFIMPRYCVNQNLPNAWITSTAQTLSKASSTDSPSITITVPGAFSNQSGFPNPTTGVIGGTHTIACQVTCPVTHLRAHPLYLRGDNTNFLQTTVTTNNIYVCGDGDNLDGTIQ